MQQGNRQTTDRVIRFLQAILPKVQRHLRQKEYQEGINILEKITGLPQIRQPKRPKVPKNMRKRMRRTAESSKRGLEGATYSIYVPGQGNLSIPLAAQVTISKHMDDGHKVLAIKALRLAANLGIREAKETVEHKGNF